VYTKLCTVISTLRWAVLTVLWIGFCHTGPFSLCINLSVCILCFCYILHSCCVIVSTVGWTLWYWSLILRTYLHSVLWHCWFRHLTRKNQYLIWPIMCLVGRQFNSFWHYIQMIALECCVIAVLSSSLMYCQSSFWWLPIRMHQKPLCFTYVLSFTNSVLRGHQMELNQTFLHIKK